MKWKKHLALFLAFVMILSMFGCGSTENTPETGKETTTENKTGDEETSSPETKEQSAQAEVITTEGTALGDNAVLMATLDAKASYEYKLDSKDYTICIEIKEQETESWTPFIGRSNTEFTVSDDSVIEYKVNRGRIDISGMKAGECVITAVNGDRTATALVRVETLEDDWDAASPVAYYLVYLAEELEPLSDEQRVEYLLSMADYASILQADKKVDGSLMNSMAAACLLYPTSYLINNYASLLMSRQKYEEALLWLEQADMADPHNPIILTNMAECCYGLGNLEMTMVYTDMAIAAQNDFGLAHLLQSCVYLKQGSVRPAMESLFRSAKTCWTDVTTELMESLYQYVMDYTDKNDEMILDKELLDILMEAASYGTTSDGRDNLDNQISVPFPAPITSAALNSQASYFAQSQQFYKQTEPLRTYREYEGSTVTLASDRMYNDDVRTIYIARFHMLYYEYMIDQWSDGKYYTEERDRLTNQFNKHYQSTWAPVEEQMAEWGAEVYAHAEMVLAGFGLSVVDDKEAAEIILKNTEEFWTKYEKYEIESYKLQIATQESLRDQWHDVLIQIEEAKMDGYERHMQPLLEEYYQRLNAILGYMQSDTMRLNFERRVMYTINMEGLVKPLQIAGADLDEVNRFDADIEHWRAQLNNAYSDRQKAKDQEVKEKAVEAKLQKARAERQKGWSESLVIGLPPLSPIQVHIGFNGDNLVYGYGAFGHDIMYERDFKNGTKTQTITSRASMFPGGLAELDAAIRGVNESKDILLSSANLSGADLAKFAKGKVIGGIPSFDASETTGSVYVYNSEGTLIDAAKIRSKEVGASWGALGGSIETTTTRSTMHTGYLTNPVNTSNKAKLSFGGLIFQREISTGF